MYTQQDILRAKKKWQQFLICAAVVAAVLLGLMFVGLLGRIEWLAYAAAVLLVIVQVLSWGLHGTYAKRYYKFLDEIKQSLHHDVNVTFEKAGEGIVFRAGLPYHPFTAKEDPKRTLDLYFDAYRPFPDWKEGQKLQITLIGAIVIGWEEVE